MGVVKHAQIIPLNGVVSTPQLKLMTWLALVFSTFALVTGQFKRSYVKP